MFWLCKCGWATEFALLTCSWVMLPLLVPCLKFEKHHSGMKSQLLRLAFSLLQICLSLLLESYLFKLGRTLLQLTCISSCLRNTPNLRLCLTFSNGVSFQLAQNPCPTCSFLSHSQPLLISPSPNSHGIYNFSLACVLLISWVYIFFLADPLSVETPFLSLRFMAQDLKMECSLSSI